MGSLTNSVDPDDTFSAEIKVLILKWCLFWEEIWTKTPWFSNPKIDIVEMCFILEILN